METSQLLAQIHPDACTPVLSCVPRLVGVEARPGNGFFSGEEAAVPRKEVIQPHLPVRLPCYDFTPITNPTLDACPSSSKENELAQRLQVLPTFVV